ncbi:hypothetical protein [Demequina sp.]|uniref:hypothetical protein n=1 Tax=Demequina sp. TaxID=2050685 RepID=UPI003D0998D8
MARYAGWVPRPFAEVWPTLDAIAMEQGWTVGPSSTMERRHYSKSMSAWSWGSDVIVTLQDVGTHTRLTFDTMSTSLVDYAKARGVMEKLMSAIGGTLDA